MRSKVGQVPFAVATQRLPGESRLILSGEVDLTARAALTAAIAAVSSPSSTLVLDLTDVTFFDSTGVAAIAHAIADNAKVRVLNPGPLTRRVLEISGVAPYVEITGTPSAPSPDGLSAPADERAAGAAAPWPPSVRRSRRGRSSRRRTSRRRR